MSRCPTCGRQPQRSTEQNRRYWALLNAIAECVHPMRQVYAPDSWHLFFRGRFLGCEDVRLPNGRVITQPRSTAGLDVGPFNDYMTQVETWAAEHDCYLPETTDAL